MRVTGEQSPDPLQTGCLPYLRKSREANYVSRCKGEWQKMRSRREMGKVRYPGTLPLTLSKVGNMMWSEPH